jgi:hypothetical protein
MSATVHRLAGNVAVVVVAWSAGVWWGQRGCELPWNPATQPAPRVANTRSSPPEISPPERWPSCPSVWSVVASPDQYVGMNFSLRGFVLLEFEYAELFTTFSELETRVWQHHARVPVPPRQLLLLRFDTDLLLPESDYADRDVVVSGHVEPVRWTDDAARRWDGGVRFVVRAIEPATLAHP